jgi:hypothetical protein
MKPPSDAALDKEYDANKLNVPQDLRNAMKAAANVLTDTASMHKYLKSLDDAMLKIYVDLLKEVDASASSTKAGLKAAMELSARKEEDPSRHLLSLALTKFETDMSFGPFATVNGHPRIIQMTGLLSSTDFIQTVINGHMAKDYVTAEHGVYSHRIQWYCLGKSGKFDADLKTLFIKFQQGIAWLLTFDRRPEHPRAVKGGNGNIEPTDFRTPETLHTWLKETDDAVAVCPLLASYIRSKNNKVKSNGKSWVAVRRVVAARKLFPAKKKDLAWKDLGTKDIESLLRRTLDEKELKELDAFLKESNVLYPQKDGTYKTTAEVS